MEKSRILVVDDEEDNRTLLVAQLEVAGYQADSVPSGRLLVSMINSARLDGYRLILLDWMMPEVDGMEILELLKHHPRYATIPVVFQTARVHPKDEAWAIQAGASGFLKKPFGRKELLKVVDPLLAQSKTVGEEL